MTEASSCVLMCDVCLLSGGAPLHLCTQPCHEAAMLWSLQGMLHHAAWEVLLYCVVFH